jgi:glycosyltransferase involved in cell wall biosynthesis
MVTSHIFSFENMSMQKKLVTLKKNISEMGLRHRKYLLFIGSLTKAQGVHYLIEAFKQLENTAKTPNNFKLVVVANSSQDDDEDYVKYVHTISERRDNIIFICATEEGIIKHLLSSAYLYVETSHDQGLESNLVAQVMRQGVAVLVSDIEKHLEITQKNGFAFKAKSVVNLRDRLAYLLSRPEEVILMGEKGKKYIIKKRFESDTLGKKKKSKDTIILAKHNTLIWNLKNLLKKA